MVIDVDEACTLDACQVPLPPDTPPRATVAPARPMPSAAEVKSATPVKIQPVEEEETPQRVTVAPALRVPSIFEARTAARATVEKPAVVQPAEEEEEFPEDDEDWVPTSSNGKQKSPNAIRSEITRFLATGAMTQTAFLKDIGCNSNSYGRFMRLKGTWNGTQNGVYWGAARFFERQKRKAEQEKREKRKAERAAGPGAAKRKRAEEADARKKAKGEGDQFLQRVSAIDVPENCPVYDSCAEIKVKMTAFFQTGVLTQTAFLKHIGCQSNQLQAFMAQPRADPQMMHDSQPGAASRIYQRAYRFFEQKRLMEGNPKSAARLKNEAMLAKKKAEIAQELSFCPALVAKYAGEGFGLRHDDGRRIVLG